MRLKGVKKMPTFLENTVWMNLRSGVHNKISKIHQVVRDNPTQAIFLHTFKVANPVPEAHREDGMQCSLALGGKMGK